MLSGKRYVLSAYLLIRSLTAIQVKKPLYDDPRYDAVGSSSLREELFNTYLKGIGALAQSQESSKTNDQSQGHQPERESKEARRERALREREQKVKIEQRHVNSSIEKSRTGMNQEEGERLFKCVDVIFNPHDCSCTTLTVLYVGLCLLMLFETHRYGHRTVEGVKLIFLL